MLRELDARRVFGEADADGSGGLDERELAAALVALGHADADAKALLELFGEKPLRGGGERALPRAAFSATLAHLDAMSTAFVSERRLREDAEARAAAFELAQADAARRRAAVRRARRRAPRATTTRASPSRGSTHSCCRTCRASRS